MMAKLEAAHHRWMTTWSAAVLAVAGCGGSVASPESAEERTEPPPATGAAPDRSIAGLVPGRTWTYEVRGGGLGCPPGRHVAKVVAHPDACARPVVEHTGFCGESPINVSLLAVNGDDVQVCTSTGLHQVTAAPVAEGTHWDQTGITYAWQRAPAPVTVTAGVFEDCWKKVIVAPERAERYETTYCRGVGIVRFVSRELDVELVAKGF